MQALHTKTVVASRQPLRCNALFKGKPAVKTAEKEKPEEPKQSMLGSTLNALDFTATRSKSDARLLWEAKQGKVGEDGRLTPEQYQALRRKVIGTAKDYWKDYVEDEAAKNIKTYYKPSDAGGTVPYLPLLVGVVLAMLATTVVVIQQTS